MQEVNVDSFVPVNQSEKPCFSRCVGPELWLLILEKVWAKIHGSYDMIMDCQVDEILRDLTGAPVYSYYPSEDDIWPLIIMAEKS